MGAAIKGDRRARALRMAERKRATVCDQGLFPNEVEVARRLGQSAADWRAKAIVIERFDMPRIDPIMAVAIGLPSKPSGTPLQSLGRRVPA